MLIYLNWFNSRFEYQDYLNYLAEQTKSPKVMPTNDDIIKFKQICDFTEGTY